MCRKIAKYGGFLALLTFCFVPVSWGQGDLTCPALFNGTTICDSDGVYNIDVFQNLFKYDGEKKTINDGVQGDASPAGNLCDDIYVFNQEQLVACCGCYVTPNGSRDFDVNVNFNNPRVTLKQLKYPSIVLKEISSGPVGAASDCNQPSGCGACDPRTPTPTPGLHGLGIHVESVAGVVSATDAWEPFADLSAAENTDLGEDCSVLFELKSGPSCTCGTFN